MEMNSNIIVLETMAKELLHTEDPDIIRAFMARIVYNSLLNS